jgi:hypothetical protein
MIFTEQNYPEYRESGGFFRGVHPPGGIDGHSLVIPIKKGMDSENAL